MFVHQPKEWLQAREVSKIVSLPRRPSNLLTRVAETVAAWRRRTRELNEVPAMSCAALRDIGIRPNAKREQLGPTLAEYIASKRSSSEAAR